MCILCFVSRTYATSGCCGCGCGGAAAAAAAVAEAAAAAVVAAAAAAAVHMHEKDGKFIADNDTSSAHDGCR